MADYSGAGAIAGSILNFVANERNNALQQRLQSQAQDWNAQQAKNANQWSIEQWNRENAYNDPSEQMERLSKAGINPALAYASGVFNQAATSPGVSMPEGAKAARTQAWQNDPLMFASLENSAAQRDLMEAQAEGIRHNTAREDAYQGTRIQLSQSQIGHLDSLSNYLGELKKTVHDQGEWYKMLSANEQIEYNKSMATLNSTIDAIKASNQITRTQADTIYDQIETMLNLQKAQAHAAWQSGNASKEQIEYYKSLEQYYDDALTSLTKAQTGEAAARTAEASASAAHHRASAGYTSEEKKYIPIKAVSGAARDGAAALRDGALFYSQVTTGKAKGPMKGYTSTWSSTMADMYQ